MDTIIDAQVSLDRNAVITTTWAEYDEVRFLGQSNTEKALRVTQKEEGFVSGTETQRDTLGQQWRRFQRGRGKKETGWVLDENLEIGDSVGPVRIVRTESLTVSQTSDLTQRGNTRLERTTRLLFSEIEANRGLLASQGLGSYMLNYLNKHADELVPIFLKSIPVAVRQVIENGDFTSAELINLPSNPDYILHRYSPDRVVIYAILFEDIDGEYGVYVGKTINAGHRVKQHVQSLQNENVPGQMYRIGRRASDRTFIQLLELKDVPPKQVNTMLQIFEHVFVCLFRSWVKVLLRDSESLEQTEKYFTDAMAATICTRMIDRICISTGWSPLGLIDVGLNWKTPLFETRIDRALWTVREIAPHEETGPIRIHTTQPRKVSIFTGDGWNQVGVMKGKGLDLLSWHGAPHAGTVVSIIVEIYTGEGKRHPIPFARFPEPGPFSDWDDMNRIGIRLEWVDENGKLWSEPRQAKNIWRMKKFSQERIDKFTPSELKAYPHLLSLYFQLRRFYNSLRSVQYTNDEIFSWLKIGYPIVVKELTYDHLTNKVTITDQAPLLREPPTLRSFEENIEELHELYSKHCRDGSLVFGDRPSGALLDEDLSIEVTSCALCHEIEHPTGRKVPCPSMPMVPDDHPTEEEQLPSCDRCFALRRPCVHVNIHDLYQVKGLRYLRELPRASIVAQNLELPSWSQDMGAVDEEIDDDITVMENEDEFIEDGGEVVEI